MTNFNPLQVINALKTGQNPQQIILQITKERLGSTPFGQNIVNLAEQNKSAEIESIVRNICNQRGIDFDKEFNSFKKQMGIS